MIIHSLRLTVVVVQQQVPRGGYSLGPEPQKPALPRALDQERAAVAAMFQTTMLPIATNRCSNVAVC